MVIYSSIHDSLVQSPSLSRLHMPWFQRTPSMQTWFFVVVEILITELYWLNYTSRDTRAIDVDTRMAITDWLQSYYVLTVITCLYIVLFSAVYSLVIYYSTSCRNINSLRNDLNIVISADKISKYILLNCTLLFIDYRPEDITWSDGWWITMMPFTSVDLDEFKTLRPRQNGHHL